MWKTPIFFILIGLLTTAYAQEYIEISDTAFERYLVDIEKDDKIDGNILKDSALSIISINMYKDPVTLDYLHYYPTNLSCLSEFTNLEIFYTVTDSLIEISFPKESIRRIYLDRFTNITGSDITLPTLDFIDGIDSLRYLTLYSQNLQDSDTSLYLNAENITIEQVSKLKTLSVNESAVLRLKHNHSLRKVTSLNMRQGTSNRIDLFNNRYLEEVILESKDNMELSSIDFWYCNNIKSFISSGIVIPELTITSPKLEELHLSGIIDVNLSITNSKIQSLSLANAEKISALNLSGNEFLTCLNLEGCTNMSSINLDNCYNLNCVQVESNYISVFPNKISSQESVGSYEVTDECSMCDFTIPEHIEDIIYEDLTFIDRTEYEKDLFLYPNPADDQIIVQMESNAYSSLAIRNISGQIVKKELVANQRMNLDVSDLGSGIYFIELQGPERRITKKIVIE